MKLSDASFAVYNAIFRRKEIIEVTVICITYNQEKYLKQTLDSILAQKTSFQFEIIVHDDASTDSTADIARFYQRKYPDIVRLLSEKENQFSKGRDFVTDIIKNSAKGKFIAMCEGDDYWICDEKLQIQWETLSDYPECDMCACWGTIVSEDGAHEISQIRPKIGDGLLGMSEVILGGGLYLATAGLFFRKSMYDEMYPFEHVLSIDYTMQMKGALRGGICYIDRKMAAYRRYSEGSWTNTVLVKPEKLKEHWKKEIRMLNTLDEDTVGKYHEIISERLKAYIPFEDQLQENDAEIALIMKDNVGKRFIWGMGRRGKGLEKYFHAKGIDIDGVCDAINRDIGCCTEQGNMVYSTDEVFKKADIILASTRAAYDELVKKGFKGRIIDFQKYMPYG